MKNRSNKGFTLLELLVTLAVVVLALFAFFRVLNSTTRVNAKNDRDIKAINLAQSEIENLRSQIKSKGDEGNLEIQNTINPKINNPQESDIDEEGIKIPLSNEGNDNIKWIENNNKFILSIVNSDYTNLQNSTINGEQINARSQIIYKKKSSDNLYYTVQLTIKRESVSTKNKDTSMYIYNVSAEAKLEEDYFSKKETNIKSVSFLSGKTEVIETNPPVGNNSDNYLVYCLNKAANLFKNASKSELYNMIIVNKVIGDKTLIQMVAEESIDIVKSKEQINKILQMINIELSNINSNSQIDFINEAMYYSKVADYTLDYLSSSMQQNLSNAHSLVWNTIHEITIKSYNTKFMELYNLSWNHGLSQAYSYFHGLLTPQMAKFTGYLSKITQTIHSNRDNATDDNRKLILDEVNELIDEIIRHEVYDIEKYTRENIDITSVIDKKDEVLNSLNTACRELVELKSIIYGSNYYKNE